MNSTILHDLDLLKHTKEMNGSKKFLKKPKSIWDLKDWDKYFYIDFDLNCISHSTYTNHSLDNFRIASWNAFLSEQEAEKELNKKKAIYKIKRYCWENEIDTEYNTEIGNCYCFNLDMQWEVVFFDDCKNWNHLGYFSHDNSQKILDKFEEELKIILN